SGSDSSESSTLKASQRRFFGDRWYWSGLLQFDRNDSLGLDLRTLLGGGLGRYVVQTNARQVIAFTGLGLSNEQFTNADDVESVELMFGAGYDAFRFDDPQLDLHSALMLFPSLTVSGRIRAQAEISLSYELIKDFYFKLGFSGTYDSEPQSVGAERDDYSVTTSIGYKF
ncbi:MAG TPA: DUF481 domain-containing protein, partial [Steroidobacteraceae bacterium]|nr:DUF481 domain-containing protein [Steroidobacteraceae bacterium]